MKQVKDKLVLITGGAGGIGRAMAECFQKAGARVVISDANRELLSRTSAEIGASACHMDVLDAASIQAAREQILKEHGPIDILINNAGIVYGGEFGSIPLEKHLLTYRVNTLGLVAVTHAFYSDLLSRPESHIVLIASASGYIPLPHGATYASSKWAVIGFGDSLRSELKVDGKTHVHVSVICPSYIDTGLFDGAKPPLLAPLLKTGDVASAVLRSVLRNRAVLNMPWIVNIIPTMRGLLPRRLYEFVLKFTGTSLSMLQWKGKTR